MNMSISMPDNLRQDLEEICEKQGRSMSNYIVLSLRNQIKRDKEEEKK